MSKKKAIARKQRPINERARLKVEKGVDRRVMEVTGEDCPELGEQPNRANVDSLRQLRKTIAKFEKGHRAQLLWILAEIYREAWDLQTGSTKVWCAFLREDFWVGRKLSSPKMERKNAFTLLCEYGFNTKTAIDRKRTCKFGQTMSYYNEIGVEPDNLIAAIKEAGGLEKAYKLSVDHRKAKTSKKSSIFKLAKVEADKPSENGSTSDDKGVFRKADDEPHAAVTFDIGGTSKKSKSSEKFVMKRHLREQLHNVENGQEVTLVCVFLGEDDQGRARVKVREVTPTKIAKDRLVQNK